MASKKIFVIVLLAISLIGLSGCVAGARISGSVLVQPQPTCTALPLYGLVIRNINFNSYYLENSFLMEGALRRELIAAGAQFGPSGAVLNGDLRIIRSGHRPFCRATMIVNVESFSPTRLYSSTDVDVDCNRGTVFVYPQDYQQAAQSIVRDFIWQMNH